MNESDAALCRVSTAPDTYLFASVVTPANRVAGVTSVCAHPISALSISLQDHRIGPLLRMHTLSVLSWVAGRVLVDSEVPKASSLSTPVWWK